MGEGKIFIVTGLVGSGKTTGLQSWIKEKKNVKGILTPVIDNKRKFYDIHSDSYFEMLDDSVNALVIGKYRFSKTGFERAEKIIQEGIHDSDWLVIDEIGPLELRGEGFNLILKNILNISERKFNLILVIREGLIPDVQKHFGIGQFEIIPF